MSIALRPIEDADLDNIMRWRMDEDITRYMNTNPKLTPEGQREWLGRIRADKNVRYWLIEIGGIPAGVINITGLENPEGKLGWAYYVGEKRLRSIQAALALEMSMYDYVFDVLGKKAVLGDVFALNTGVIQLHRLCGCEIVKECKNAVCKEGVWYDVVYLCMTAERWMKIRNAKKYEKIVFDKQNLC